MDKTLLSRVHEFDEIKGDVECRFYVVGHLGSDQTFCTLAESRRMAALAYVAYIGARRVPAKIGNVWAKSEFGVQTFPLIHDTEVSIRNWIEEDRSRAPRLQEAVKQIKSVVS